MNWLRRVFVKRDPNRSLSWCVGCPDHEGCSQGACYLDGGPAHPLNRCAIGGCRFCRNAPLLDEVTEFVIGALGNLARTTKAQADFGEISPYYAETATRLEQAFRSGALVITEDPS